MMIAATTNPFDDSGPRTLAWYACHGFYEDGRLYAHDPEQGFANCPSVGNKLRLLTEAGLHDLVPTPENMRSLLTEHAAWQTSVDQSWTHYEAARGTVREVLHWVLATMMKDPTLDQGLLRLVFELAPGHEAIALVRNSNCPDDIRDFYLQASGANDPSKTTKGGEIGVFMLHDRQLPSKYVDLIARRCRKASTQALCVSHPNASQITLAWIVHFGKSVTTKQVALWIMFQRGMLKL